nr:cytochrome c3 family protein [uncultured Desulfobacter sp.]
MMKHKIYILLTAALITLGMCLYVQADEGNTFEPPEDGLAINYIKGHSSKDLSVTFNHSSHESFECIDCHHKMGELKGEAPPRSCATCHDNFSPDNVGGDKSYFKAMHQISFTQAKNRSCLGCHTNEMGKDDKDMTGCNASACHSQGIR